MAGYPLGGLGRTETDTGAVELFDVIYTEETFIGRSTQTSFTVPKGTVLARVVGGSGSHDGKVATMETTETTVIDAQIPLAVLGSDVTVAASAVDQFIRVIVSGQVRGPKVTTIVGQTSSALTVTVEDQLQQTGIIPQGTTELTAFDN